MSRLGPLVAPGRTADVYEDAERPDRVVKVYHDDWHDAEIDREVRDAVLARELGVTPIGCAGRIDADGRRGVVFDRVHGIPLTAVAERDLRRIPEVGRTLARVQARMHAVHTDRLPDVREVAVSLLDERPFDSLEPDERARLVDALRALPAGDSVLHLDCHPLNVFEHDGDHAIIDWQSASRGDRAADVAMTRVLFTEAELFPGISPVQRVLYQTVRRIMLRAYLRGYRAIDPIDDAEVERWMTAARVIRLGLLDVASERKAALRRIRAAVAVPTGGDAP